MKNEDFRYHLLMFASFVLHRPGYSLSLPGCFHIDPNQVGLALPEAVFILIQARLAYVCLALPSSLLSLSHWLTPALAFEQSGCATVCCSCHCLLQRV